MARKTLRLLPGLLSFLLALAAAAPLQGASEWKLWPEREKAASAPAPGAPREPAPPKEPKDKTAGAKKLGEEIQGMAATIDLYRSEAAARKNELAELKKKQQALAEIEKKLGREKTRKERTGLLAEREKMAAEVSALTRLTSGHESFIRSREAAIAELEKGLQDLRQRQQAIYLRYLYRFLIVAGGFALAWGLARIVGAVLDRVVREKSKRSGLKRLVRGIVYLTAILLALAAGLENPTQLAAFLAILSAGLAFALKDFLSCCIGWFMLVFTRQIRVGDIVEIGPVKGRVADISILKTTVQEWRDHRDTGRTAFFGNNFIFSYPLYNSSLRGGDIIDHLEIRIPPGADWHRCVHTLRQTGDALRQRGEMGDFSVIMTFEQGGVVVSFTFRAQPDEIPRLRELVLTVAGGIIWDETVRPAGA